ncbi:MAG: MCP four helix bundle domain-containing protein, partial [Pseudomonadota bacterium]|nr:MCP four helix bundle domain-containing protein [Pseudomonadota bacterium]
MLKSIKLATKLFGSFLIVLALMAGLGTYAISQLATVNGSTVDLATNWLPSVRAALNLKANVHELRGLEYRIILDVDAAAIAEDEKQIAEETRALIKQEEEYSKLVSSSEERQAYEAFKNERTAFLAEQDKVVALARVNKNAEATVLMNGDSRKSYDILRQLGDKLSDINVEGGNKSAAEAAAVYSNARLWTINILVGCVVLALLMAFAITRSLTRQLGGEPVYVAEIATRVADGDLTMKIDTRAGDASSVLYAMQSMVNRLSQVVSDVNSGAEALAGASEEVSSTAQSLSQAASEQAAGVEETSASMEQM